LTCILQSSNAYGSSTASFSYFESFPFSKLGFGPSFIHTPPRQSQAYQHHLITPFLI
jgi:hypothetical protein